MIIGRFRHVIRNILIQQLLTNTEDQESTASIKTEEGKTSFQGGAGQEVIMNLKWQYLMLVKILFFLTLAKMLLVFRISIKLEEIKYVLDFRLSIPYRMFNVVARF